MVVECVGCNDPLSVGVAVQVSTLARGRLIVRTLAFQLRHPLQVAARPLGCHGDGTEADLMLGGVLDVVYYLKVFL